MTRLTTLTLAAVVASFGTGVAQATPVDGPSGQPCGLHSVTDPGTEGGDVQTGALDAGPFVATDRGANPDSGTVTCTIQVGGATHAEANNGASASASGTGVIVLIPTLVSYNSPANVPIYLCTQFTYDGGDTIYWADSNDPSLDGHWDTSPTVACARTGTDPEPFSPRALVDSIICPVLAILGSTLPDVPGVFEIDNQGDVTLTDIPLWDCPPHRV